MKTSVMRPVAGLAAALCLLTAGLASAQIAGPPNRIDYQGQVLDSSGNPLANTTPTNYTMQFRLWDAQTGGTLVWSESQTVTVSKGAFSVRLGEGIAIPADNIPTGVQTAGLSAAFGQKDRYLGLTVVQTGVTPAEITPRLAFLASPFSFNSQKAVEADNIAILDAGGNNRIGSLKLDQIFNMSTTVPADRANPAKWTLKEVNVPAGVSVPVGGVIMWWGSATALPAGFELCNGGAPTTAGALISSKPDLRDRFVKGPAATTGNVATNNTSGGTNSITSTTLTSAGTSITQAQLPSYTLPNTLAIANGGAHQHAITDTYNDAEDDDDGDNGKLASGQGNGLRPFPTLYTNVDGAHSHTITGSITSGGSNATHSHSVTLPTEDNRPAFLEMFFIIRVK